MDTFDIVPSGDFSLRESAEFGFGQRHSDVFDGVFRLTFVTDDFRGQVGVELRQDATGLHAVMHGGDGDRSATAAQVARMLSLDHDIPGFAEVGRRDPLIGSLQRVAPGLLPPLFHSPYEAAVWSVLSARRPARQMAEVRRLLSERHGRSFELAGRVLSALPTPEQLLGVQEFPGLPPEKIARLHGVARAALAGDLDVARLRSMGPQGCDAAVQRLRGIGPMYASLITIRAVGFTDVLPIDEPKIRELVTRLYQLPQPCSAAEFELIAQAWRPYRTWASVLIRAASDRL